MLNSLSAMDFTMLGNLFKKTKEQGNFAVGNTTLLDEVDIEKVSPMMQHYIQTKREYKDCILFYRLGDFYEIFFDDALVASKELELTLTGKACGLEERAPMCGVPFHAVDSYLNKLVSRGYKVAICEQMEEPKLAKGLLKEMLQG